MENSDEVVRELRATRHLRKSAADAMARHENLARRKQKDIDMNAVTSNMTGNPYFKEATSISGDADTLLRAVAFELRTANLLAAYHYGSSLCDNSIVKDEITARLGLEEDSR